MKTPPHFGQKLSVSPRVLPACRARLHTLLPLTWQSLLSEDVPIKSGATAPGSSHLQLTAPSPTEAACAAPQQPWGTQPRPMATPLLPSCRFYPSFYLRDSMQGPYTDKWIILVLSTYSAFNSTSKILICCCRSLYALFCLVEGQNLSCTPAENAKWKRNQLCKIKP